DADKYPGGRPTNPLAFLIHPKLILQLIGAFGWKMEQIEKFKGDLITDYNFNPYGGPFRLFKIDPVDAIWEFWDTYYGNQYELQVLDDKERSMVHNHPRRHDLDFKASIQMMNYLNNLYFIFGMTSFKDNLKKRSE